MALDIRTGIVNNKASMIIADVTGDYNALTNPGGWIQETARDFTSGVNVSNDTLTYNNHGFYTGQVLTYEFSGTGMASVVSGTELYANVVDSNTLKFALYPTYPGLLPVLDLNNTTLSSNSLTPYNDVRARVSAISLEITTPGASSALSPIDLYATSFWTSPSYAYDLTSSVNLSDGVWKFVITYTVDGNTIAKTNYVLRDNVIKCAIAKLALGDMTSNDYAEIKLMYDKMLQAMECEEFVLAQTIYEDIVDALSSCAIDVRKGCGC